MPLSVKTITQFVKATKDDAQQSQQKETIVYGKITSYDETNKICYVRFDGATQDTPVKRFTASVNPDEIVTIMIKNHTAIITGNLKSPAAGDRQIINAVNKRISTIKTVDESYIDSLWADYPFE